jgi:hypothetical protein
MFLIDLRELKAFLDSRGVDHSTCVGKSEPDEIK